MSLLLSKISVRLRLKDEDGNSFLLPVSSFQQTFALNELPSCTVQLSVGANANRRSLPLAIPEEAMPLLREHNYCELVSIIEGDYATGVEWNSDPQVIFYGKISNVANVLVRKAASLSVTLRHWLSDLQSGTILSGYANPADARNNRLQASTYGSADPFGLNTRAAIGALADAKQLATEQFTEDIWANGIKEFMSRLLTQPIVGPMPVGNELPESLACADNINVPSSSLLEAWTRLEGASTKLGSEYSKWAVPSTIGAEGLVDNPRIIDALRETITHDPVGAYKNTDAWSKLVNYFLPSFGLMLVPRVKTAIIAPSNVALRTPYCHRIVANDIEQIDTSDLIRRPLKSVGVIGHFQSATNLAALTGLRNILPDVVACYSNDDPANNGRTAMIEPPHYLRRFASDKAIIATSMRKRRPAGGVANPGSGADDEYLDSIEAGVSQLQFLLSEHAKYYYFTQKTQGRSCRIAGKLRFDIAPGSMVEISARPEQFNGVITDSPYLQGIVARVTNVVDVSRQLAMTSIQVGHVRTKDENDDVSFTLEKHPLYENSFTGATLLDEYENETCE